MNFSAEQRLLASPLPVVDAGRSRAHLTTGRVLGAFLVVSLGLCLFAISLSSLTSDDHLLRVLHSAGVGLLAIACLGTATLLVVADRVNLWAPLPWFLGVCGIYFGLGPELYVWGSFESVAQADSFWPVETKDLIRTNVMNCFGIFFVAAVATIVIRALSRRASARPQRVAPLTPRQLALATVLLLCVGLPIEYLLHLPHLFGSLSFVLPGSVMMLRYAVSMTITFMVVLAARQSLLWAIPLAVVLGSELLVGVLEFSKTDVIIPLVMFFLGLFIVLPKPRVIFPAAAAVAAAYLLVIPIVSFGRAEISVGNLSFYEASLGERLEILQRFIHGERLQTPENSQDWWLRLNYTGAQTFAMDEYDAGRPLKAWTLALYIFVPRLLWPDKPTMTDVGRYFNYTITGNPASSSSPGIFADGYYGNGWLGVIALSCCMGAILGAFSWYSRNRIMSGQLLFLPVVLVGINIGVRVDGWFATDCFGPLGLALCAHLGLQFFQNFLSGPVESVESAASATLLHADHRPTLDRVR